MSPKTTPQQVSGTTWKTLVAGQEHTCATRTDNTVWCWGMNTSGQLGTEDYTLRNAPVQIASGIQGVYSGHSAETTFLID